MENRCNHLDTLNTRWHDAIYWGLLLLLGAAFMVMNCLTTLKEDDMLFSLIEGEWTPLHTIADALRSLRYHYLNTNGRLADVVPVFFCALAGKAAFNVCNTLVFIAMLHLLSMVATGRRSLLVVAMFAAVVGTCYPVPGETMLWIAGSAGYMWAITGSLALVHYLLRQHQRPPGCGESIALFICALIAGGFNEATSFGFLGGLCAFYAVNRNRVDRRAAIALAGYLLGLAIIVASPGAWQRVAAGGIAVDKPLGELLASRLFIFNEKMWRLLTPIAAALVGITALVMRRGNDVRRCVWTYIGLALVLEVFALGMIHERVYAPLATVAFIIVAMVTHAVTRRWLWSRAAMIAVAMGLVVFTYSRGIKILRQYQQYNDTTVDEIIAAPSQAVLRQRSFDTYSRFIKPVNYISTNFFAHEVVYCAYYDKENVQFVNDSIYNRYHEGRLLDGAIPLPLASDRPDLTGSIYIHQGRDYMTVELKTDTFPHSFQTARYYLSSPNQGLSPQERQRRANYGLDNEYDPKGFFPLRYQGHILLVLPTPARAVTRIVIPLGIEPSDGEVTLTMPQQQAPM